MRAALSPAAAAEMVPDGASMMIGGFMGVGSPHRMISALVARGARGLTVIANDTARPGVGIGKLIDAGCVAKIVVSHIGTNPETQRLMLAGALVVELVPQGTLTERIWAGGAGLGGVLTATGWRRPREPLRAPDRSSSGQQNVTRRHGADISHEHGRAMTEHHAEPKSVCIVSFKE